jgi:signal transduction histidine kinase
MNSITPIASLTTTVTEILKDIDTTDDVPQEIDDETIIDIRNALTTIHRRSVGLMHFVQSYRNLTHIPKPVFNIVTIHEMFHNIEMLMAEDLRHGRIELMSTVLPQSLTITADENLIEQVLINLIKNSIHALEGRQDAKILLRAFMGPRGRVIVQVIDNGAGIHPDALEKIFIPFFTTKQKGSGIGLSLSRQIMRLHSGTMTVQSEPEKETCFTLRF